jgi:ABC-type multidrug transport system ATPase subunit
MTVESLLSYCKPFYPGWRDEDLAQLIGEYELPLGRRIRQLSRGMRIKAALAASLAYRPKLIVLDEPFSGLDILVREQLIESIVERTPEATAFLASHDLAEMESFATHIAYLQEGCLQFVEEMTNLTARFREVEITLDAPAGLPQDLSPRWWSVEQSGVVVRFIDSQYESTRTDAEVRARFSGVRDVTVRGLSLRAIFLALARARR